MNETVLFSPNSLMEVNHRRQLKVIMNLPVRLICEDKVMDVLPIALDPSGEYLPVKKIRRTYVSTVNNSTPDQMILFFQSRQLGSLLTTEEVAAYYNVAKVTIRRWALNGALKNYRIGSCITLYKREELPDVAVLYFNAGK